MSRKALKSTRLPVKLETALLSRNKMAAVWRWQITTQSAKVKEGVQLKLQFPSGLSLLVRRWIFTDA